MPKISNLQAIKSIAKTLLYLDFEKTAFFPIVVQHPYTSGCFVGVRTEKGTQIVNLLEDKDGLAKWRDMVKHEINSAASVMDIYRLLTKPYVLSFIELAEKHLSQNDLSGLLRDAWMRIEFVSSNPVFTQAQFARLFQKCNPDVLMTAEERKTLQGLPNEIEIYRGVRKASKKMKGMSWTTDIEVAKRFSQRFSSNNSGGDLYKATIYKTDVLAYFQGRGEREMVVDPRRLRNIIKLNLKELSKQEESTALDQVITAAAQKRMHPLTCQTSEERQTVDDAHVK